MKRYRIAIPTFPGTNGDTDNLATLTRCGFDAFIFRWNDSREKLENVDGYFMGAGFSYEDRGRSGMVAARDPLFQFLHEEASKGKVIVGNCNGAQVLVESGLIPMGDGLRMCLAHNIAKFPDGSEKATGFLNEWVWIKRVCNRDRCATAAWDGVMQMPIAHGEGRFVTTNAELIEELKENDQIAFQYADAKGNVSDVAPVTPNGSTDAIAGICNREGNVIALMPHPERSPRGDAYFRSIGAWLDQHPPHPLKSHRALEDAKRSDLPIREPMYTELLIDTVITNTEERTVEQAARRVEPRLTLKQYRYVGLPSDRSAELLKSLLFFNPNKEIAYARRDGKFYRWNSSKKSWSDSFDSPLKGAALLRRDLPDTKAETLGKGAETGVLYDCRSIDDTALTKGDLTEVFCNPHASTLERIR